MIGERLTISITVADSQRKYDFTSSTVRLEMSASCGARFCRPEMELFHERKMPKRGWGNNL